MLGAVQSPSDVWWELRFLSAQNVSADFPILLTPYLLCITAPRRMFPTMAARTGDYVLYQS